MTDTNLEMTDAINENSEQVNAITETGGLKLMGAASGLQMAMTVDKTTAVIQEYNIGGGAVDLSFVTAGAGDILAGKTGTDKSGNPVYGTIRTVTASKSGNVVTVPSGFIAAEQILTIDTAKTATVSGNVVTIYPGYTANQYTATVPKAVSSVSGNVVTIPAGYHDATTKTVAEMAEPTVSANVVTIPVGYNKTQKTKTITEAGQTTVSGNVVTTPVGYVKTERKNTVGTAKGAETITPGTADKTIAAGTYLTGALTVKGDADLISENIADGKEIFGVPGSFKGGGMDFYKCAAVYGPREVACFVISGCPNTAVNGTYLPTEFTVEDWEGNKQPVYKNTASSYFYYFTFDGWGVSTDYNNSAEYMGGVGSSWMDRDWMPIDGMSCVESMTTIDLDVPKTWDGYKAVLSNGVYNFEDELTTGMSWSDVKPEIFKVYSADVSIQLASFPRDYPTDKLVFHAPLCGDVTATEVGETLKNRNVTLETVNGIQAARFVPTSVLYTTAPLPLSYIGSSEEFSVFFCINPSEVTHERVPICIGGDSYPLYVETYTDGGSMYLRFSTNATGKIKIPFSVGSWYAVTMVSRDRTLYVYNGKTFFDSEEIRTSVNDYRLVLGARRIDGTNSFNGYMRNVLIYNRALSEAEITQLNDKFAIV
jgi:hypothetical protein